MKGENIRLCDDCGIDLHLRNQTPYCPVCRKVRHKEERKQQKEKDRIKLETARRKAKPKKVEISCRCKSTVGLKLNNITVCDSCRRLIR